MLMKICCLSCVLFWLGFLVSSVVMLCVVSVWVIG